MKRDKRGRFKKEDEWMNFTFTFPSIKKLLYWGLLLVVVLPWIIIASKFKILENIYDAFENMIFNSTKNTKEYKKNGRFY